MPRIYALQTVRYRLGRWVGAIGAGVAAPSATGYGPATRWQRKNHDAQPQDRSRNTGRHTGRAARDAEGWRRDRASRCPGGGRLLGRGASVLREFAAAVAAGAEGPRSGPATAHAHGRLRRR